MSQTPRPPRIRRPLELRRQIVEETLAPGTSVSLVARAHNVNANQVFKWRRLYHQGLLEGTNSPKLLPVRLAAPRATQPVLPATGILHLELPQACLRIEGAADSVTLRTILACLLP
jgi:transposase